ncbi:hypothetical protein MUY27_00230 [Mucilaginibacter sp. RS28]|uniref:DUF4142 domain-containing protein n=1 Tax=Mucilaginibacter straminoryzae TaxID=2932774 RepID=A0A9X2B7A4_9SPHI|nr:hypothetical protein [Mucilaginibacter straminoryzae]MCJ8208111.1 hypothetical protein [Mucilaginibacter straminoryzae]
MKKQCTFIITFLSLYASAHAQGIFNQQSSRRKIMAEQIAGIELYATALKKGYDLSRQGLTTAHDLKNGTFGLHTDYVDSLKMVSATVRNNPKANAIAEIAAKITALFTAEIRWQQAQKQLTPDELNSLKRVADNMQVEGRTDVNELSQLLTSGLLQLTDAQRLDRIDKLYADMNDKYNFTCSYTTKARRLAKARAADKQDRGDLQKLYGIQSGGL